MGLPDGYILPDNYNEACHLTGDGVVVPAVRFVAVFSRLRPLWLDVRDTVPRRSPGIDR